MERDIFVFETDAESQTRRLIGGLYRLLIMGEIYRLLINKIRKEHKHQYVDNSLSPFKVINYIKLNRYF